jgi:hypothetical protein
VRELLSGPFGLDNNREFLIGGSVGGLFGGDPSIAMYLELEGVSPQLPEQASLFLEPKDGDLTLFVRSANQGAEVDVGLSAEALLKARRLDNGELQGVEDENGVFTEGLPTEFSLTYTLNGTNPTPELSVSAKVQGKWDAPLGLEGYSLTDAEVAFGLTSTGTSLAIHTERAEFVDGATTKAFVLDLDTTWAGIVPTSLSGQFERICPEAPTPCPDLELQPSILLNMQKSFYELAFSAGSNLSQQVESKLPAQASSAFGAFRTAVDTVGQGTDALLRNSPLSWVGLRNPTFYFGTPGSTPPQRAGVERPPFGLGLRVGGELFLDVGSIEEDIADGLYGLDLSRGYYVSGTVTTPAEFGSNNFSITGAQRLPSVPSLLELSGRLEFPGASLIPGVPALAEGSFAFERTDFLSSDTTVNADLSLAGGLIAREASFQVSGREISILSLPSGCVDVPVKVEGTVDLDETINATTIFALGTPMLLESFDVLLPSNPTEVLDCVGSNIFQVWETALGIARDIVEDPTGNSVEALQSAQEAISNGARRLVEGLPKGTPGKAQLLATIDIADDAFNSGSEFALNTVNEIPGFSTLNGLVGDGLGLGLDGVGEVSALANQGFQVVNDIAGSVVGLLGPVGGFVSDGVGIAATALTNLANETVTAILSGNPSAIGAAVARQLTSVTSSISCMFKSCRRPPPTFQEHPQACGDDQYWNPVFANCFNRNAMVFMYTGREEADGKTRCLADVNGEARSQICSGRDRQQYILDVESQQIRSVSYKWNQFTSKFDSVPSKCLTVFKKEASDRFFSEEFKNCGGEYQAQQRWTYTDNGKLINDASGLCLYWPGARSPDQGAIVTTACSNITVPQGKLEWTGTAVTADYARSYLHPYQGSLRMGGRCINQGPSSTRVLDLLTFQETVEGTCDNWRFNYIDAQTVQIVLPEKTFGTGLCLTHYAPVANQSSLVTWQNCDAVNKNQRYRVHYIDGNGAPGFAPQDAGRGIRERQFVLKQAPNPETGNPGTLCLTKNDGDDIINRFASCSLANADNTFTFHPSSSALRSVIQDFEDRQASELLRQQLAIINSGQLNGAFSGLVFAEHDMCITGTSAVGGNCYPSPLSIGDSEHPSDSVRRVYSSLSGRYFCLTVNADGTMSYQRCASGRSDQLWQQQSLSADANAFVLMNVQRQQCLQPQGTSGTVPLGLADCGTTEQIIRYSLPLRQGPGFEPPVLSEVLESGEEYQEARLAFIAGSSTTVAMQLQLGAETQFSGNRCVRLERGEFFETLGDALLQAGGCEREYRGDYNDETSVRLWQTDEVETIDGFRVHLDLNGTCLAIPSGAKPTDASLTLLTETCETNKATQIWTKHAIANSFTFRLCIPVRGTISGGMLQTTDFCLSSEYSNLLAKPIDLDNPNPTQVLRLTGPWTLLLEADLVLAPEGGNGPMSEEPSIDPEFAFQAQFGEFATFATGDIEQTTGYGNLIFDIDLDNEGEEQYCLHALTDPLTYEGFKWAGSSIPTGLTETKNEKGEDVVLGNSKYNAELRFCGSSSSDGALNGAEIAFYRSEIEPTNHRIHWRERNLCLTKPSTQAGLAYFDNCIYGTPTQSWNTEAIRRLTPAPNPDLHPEGGRGPLGFRLVQDGAVAGLDSLDISIEAKFKQNSVSTTSELEMFYRPIAGTVLTADQYGEIVTQDYSENHAVQLSLGQPGCLAIDQTMPVDQQVVVQPCQSSNDDELRASNAFTRYQAEIPNRYRIRSERTESCLTLPIYEEASGEIAIEVDQDPAVSAFCRESEESPLDLFDHDRIILNRSSGERYPFRQFGDLALLLEAPFTRQQLCDEYVRVNGGFFASIDNDGKVAKSFCDDKLQSFDDVFEQDSGRKASGRSSRERIPNVMQPFIPIGDGQPSHTRAEICNFYSLDVPVLTTSCQVGQPGQLWSRKADTDQFFIPIFEEDYCITSVPGNGITRPIARARKCSDDSDNKELSSVAPVVLKSENNIVPETRLNVAISDRLASVTNELDSLQQQFNDGAQEITGDFNDRSEEIAETSVLLLQRTDDLVTAAEELNSLLETPGLILAQALARESELAALLDSRQQATAFDPALEQQIRSLEDEIAPLYQAANEAGSLPGLLYDRAEDILSLTEAEIAKSQALKSELIAAVAELDGLMQEQQEIDQIIMRDLGDMSLSMRSSDLAIELTNLKAAMNDAIAELDFVVRGYENIAILESQYALTLIARVFNASGDGYANFDEGLFTELIVEWRDAIVQAEDTRELQLLDRQQLDDGDLDGRYSRMVFINNECIRTNNDATICGLLSISDSESATPLDKRIHALGDADFIDSCLTLNPSSLKVSFERCSRDRQDQWWQTTSANDGTFTLQASNSDLCLQLDPNPENQLIVAACGAEEQGLRLVPPISIEPSPEIPDVQSGENYRAFAALVESGGANGISMQLAFEDEAGQCLAAIGSYGDAAMVGEDCANPLLINYPLAQSFRLLPASWESADTYRLYLDSVGACLDLSSPDGEQANITAASCQYERSDQWWTREAVTSNTFRLRSRGGLDDRCLTLNGTTVTAEVCGQAGQVMRIATAWAFDSSAGDDLALLSLPLENNVPTGFVTITGEPVERAVLQVSNSLQDADGLGKIRYQWLRDGITIPGANIPSYQLVQADVGSQIRVQAIYFDGSGYLETVTSVPTSSIINTSHVPTGNVSIVGLAATGEVLSGEFDLQDNDGLGEFFFQWQRNGQNIPNAVGINYSVQLADVGSRLTLVVSYVDGEGKLEEVPSVPTSIVYITNAEPTGSVTVEGTFSVRETLTANNTLQDSNGLGRIRYQWQRNGRNIPGATARRYTLGVADLGSLVTVLATYTDGAGYIEQVSSDANGIRVTGALDGDSDGDGVSDAVDNCVTVRNRTQADFNDDGVGDACELDADADGMPDAWEIENGLNPRNTFDRNYDRDNDGFDNITEFRMGSDPRVPDTDKNNNGIPDSVDYGPRMAPILNYLLEGV